MNNKEGQSCLYLLARPVPKPYTHITYCFIWFLLLKGNDRKKKTPQPQLRGFRLNCGKTAKQAGTMPVQPKLPTQPRLHPFEGGCRSYHEPIAKSSGRPTFPIIFDKEPCYSNSNSRTSNFSFGSVKSSTLLGVLISWLAFSDVCSTPAE